MSKKPQKTQEQKELENKKRLEKIKAAIEAGQYTKEISKKDKAELIKMGVSFEEKPADAPVGPEIKPEDEQDTDGDDEDLEGHDVEFGGPDDGSDDSTIDEDTTNATKPMDETEGDKVRVYSHVNMKCHDGSELVIGQYSHISREEFERLKKDKRKIFSKD